MHKEILKKLEYDPLAEAEKATGESYKTSAITALSGFANHIKYTQDKEDLLQFYGDTHYNITFSEVKELATKLGFEPIFGEEFIDNFNKETPQNNFFEVWFHFSKGALLTLESFKWADLNYHKLNSGKLYFNWRPRNKNYYLKCFSGGYVSDRIYYGGRDIREGLKAFINEMDEEGEWITPWVKQPFLWFVNFTETKSEYNYEKINENKLQQFPKSVLDAIHEN